MEDIYKSHGVECDASHEDDDTLTQCTAASRMSRSTIFTSGATTIGDDVTISQEDIDAFTRGLAWKEDSLRSKLNTTKQRHVADEDEMQKEIAEIQAKLSEVESNMKRIENAKRDTIRELEDVKTQMSSTYSRVREVDVEDAKKNAAEQTKLRDESINDPRLDEITLEFKVLDDKLKSLSDR